MATVHTSNGQKRSFAETVSPSATAGGQIASRYRQTTAAANARGMETFASRTPLIVGIHRNAAA